MSGEAVAVVVLVSLAGSIWHAGFHGTHVALASLEGPSSLFEVAANVPHMRIAATETAAIRGHRSLHADASVDALSDESSVCALKPILVRWASPRNGEVY